MSGYAITQLLPSLSSSTGGALLDAIYGTGTTSTGSPSAALSALSAAEAGQTADIASTALQPSVARDVAAFTAGVASATSASALLANPAVLKVLLTANGLGSQTGYPALAQKALLSDPSDSSSLVNQLSDTNWKTTAETYQFATEGLSVISQPAVQASIASAYAEVTWRTSLDTAHPGLSNALSFRQSASGITSVLQILGDPILRDVVTTTLGLPAEIAVQPLEAQEKAISSRLDISQFSSSSFTETFVQRYMVAKANAAASTTTSATSLDSLAQAAAGLVA